MSNEWDAFPLAEPATSSEWDKFPAVNGQTAVATAPAPRSFKIGRKTPTTPPASSAQPIAAEPQAEPLRPYQTAEQLLVDEAARKPYEPPSWADETHRRYAKMGVGRLLHAPAPTGHAPTDLAARIEHEKAKMGNVHQGDAYEWLTERTPFVGAIVNAMDLADVYQSAKRIEAGDHSDRDMETVAKYLAKTHLAAKDYEKQGRLTKIANLATMLPGQALEFLATAGTAKAGLTAAGALAKEGVKRTLVRKAAEAVAVSAAQTALNAPRLAEGTLQFGGPQQDEHGRVTTQPLAPSFGKAFADGLIENVSERMGGEFGLGKLRNRVASWMAAKTGITVPEAMQKIANKAAFDGAIGEWAEERYGELMRLAAGQAGVELTSPDQTVVGQVAQGKLGDALDQSLVEVAAFSAMPIAGVGAGIASDIVRGKKKLSPIPTDAASTVAWVEANPEAADKIAGRVAKDIPFTQAMADEISMYRGNAELRTKFGDAVATAVAAKKAQAEAAKPTEQQPAQEPPKEEKPSVEPVAAGPTTAQPEAKVPPAQPAATQPQDEAAAAVAPPAADHIAEPGKMVEPVAIANKANSANTTQPQSAQNTGETNVRANKPEPAVAEDFSIFGAIKQAAPDLASRYSSSAGVSEGYTIEDHSRRVADNVLASLPEQTVDDIQSRTGIRVADTMRFAAALHDIGKADAVAAGDKSRQHEFTGPIVRRVLNSAAAGESFPFNEQERTLIESLSTNDVVGSLVQDKITARQAAEHIRGLAEKTGISPEDYLTLQSAFYKADAGDYPKLKKSLFRKRANGREALNSPEYAALEDLIYGEVREIPWMERFDAQGEDAGSGRSDRRKPELVHGTAVAFDQFDEGKDRGTNAVGPGVYLLAKADQDVADDYAARAMRGILGLFPKPSQKKLADATPDFLNWHIRRLRALADNFAKGGNTAQQSLHSQAADVLQGMLDGRIGKRVVDVDFEPKRTLVLGDVGSGGAVVSPADLASIAASIPAEQRAAFQQRLEGTGEEWKGRGTAVYNALAATVGSKAAANNALLDAGFDSIQFLHAKGGYTRRYGVLVALQHSAAKPITEAKAKPPAAKAAEPAKPEPAPPAKTPLPPAIAALDDAALTDFLVQMGALKKGLRKIKPRAELEDLARTAIFGEKPPQIIRFAKTEAEPVESKPVATRGIGKTTPVSSAEPQAVAPAASEAESEPQAAQPQNASNAIPEAQAEPDKETSQFTVADYLQPGETARAALVRFDRENGYDQLAEKKRVGFNTKRNADLLRKREADERRNALVDAAYEEARGPTVQAAPFAKKPKMTPQLRELHRVAPQYVGEDRAKQAAFIDFVDEQHKPKYDAHVERERAKKELRSLARMHAGDISRFENSDRDNTKSKRFDELSHYAWQNADLAPLGLEKNNSDQIWNILKEGVLPAPKKTDPKFLQRAADKFNGLWEHRHDRQDQHPDDNPLGDVVDEPSDESGLGRSDRREAASQEPDAGAVPPSDSGVLESGGRTLREGPAAEGDLAGGEEGDTSFNPLDFGDPTANEGFTLEREPAKKLVAEKFENNTGEQRSLIEGRDALPGQEDLFQVEGQGYRVRQPSMAEINRRALTKRDFENAVPGAKVAPHPIEKNAHRLTLPNGDILDIRQNDYIPIGSLSDAAWKIEEKRIGREIPRWERQEWIAHGSCTITLQSGARTSPAGLICLANSADKGTLREELLHFADYSGFFKPGEREALVEKYSSPDKSFAEQSEDIARAYSERGPDSLFTSIANWIRDFLRNLGFGTLNADDVFRMMDTPMFWSRRPERMLAGTAFQVTSPNKKDMTPEYKALLANPGITKQQRDLADKLRDEQTRVEIPIAETAANADAEYKADPEAARERVKQVAAGEKAARPEDVHIARTIFRKDADAANDGDAAAIKQAFKSLREHDEIGTNTGRTLRQFHDPMETPEQRNMRLLQAAIHAPSDSIKSKIDAEEKTAKEERRPPNIDAIVNDHVKQTQKLLLDLGKVGISPRNFGRIAKSQADTVRVLRDIQTHRSGLSDKVFEYWIAAVLSGIPTQSRNIAGTTLNAGWYLTGQKLAEATINKGMELIGQRKRAGATFEEFKYVFPAMGRAIGQASRNFLSTFRDEIDSFETIFKTGRGGLVDNAEHRFAIKGKTGRVIRLPLRLMQAVDSFMKTIIVHGIAAERAARIGVSEGLSGEALGNRVAELTGNNPVGSMLDMRTEEQLWKESIAKTHQLAFQQKDSEASPWTNKAKIGIGHLRELPMGRYLIPFLNATVNIFATGLKKSPLGIVDLLRKAYKGDVAHITEDLAEQAIAWGIVMALAGQDEDDPWITGSDGVGGTGEHRYSVWLPGTNRYWYYGHLEPFATAAGVTVDGVRAFKNGTDPNRIIGAFTGQLKEKTFSQSMGDIIRAIENEDTGGAKLAEWAAGFGASFMPNLVRSTGREYDTEVMNRRVRGLTREEYTERLGKRFVQNLEVGAQDWIPGMEDQPRFTIFGDTLKRAEWTGHPATDLPFRLLVPASPSKYQPFVGMQFIAAWKNRHPEDVRKLIYPARPTYSLNGEMKSMTDAQEAEYAKFSGQVAKKLVELGNYDPKNPTKDQWDAFTDDFEKAREVAKELLVAQWTGGKKASLDAKEVAEAIAAKEKRSAIKTLRSIDSNADRNIRRPGESLVNYRERREGYVKDAAKAKATLNRMNKGTSL